MKVFILVAGKGSRLGEIGSGKPKCLTRICGESLIQEI